MGGSGVPPLTRPGGILRQVEQMPLIAMAFFLFLRFVGMLLIDSVRLTVVAVVLGCLLLLHPLFRGAALEC